MGWWATGIPIPCHVVSAYANVWLSYLECVVAVVAWDGNVVAVWQGTYMQLGVSASY